MKNFIAIALFALFAAACTPAENAGVMNKGMMCEKCPCCQKMMGDAAMKDSMMKDGKMQCPMMNGDTKDGIKCSCCQKMMKGSMKKNQSQPTTNASGAADHTQHHPAK